MIKQLEVSDESVVQLSQQCFEELRKIYHPTEMAKINKTREPGEWKCFGFYSGGALVAVVKAKLVDSELQISSLAVMPNFRRQGVARSLLKSTISHFQSVCSVSVWCVEQTGNVAIFIALGFKVVQRFDSDYFALANGETAIEVQLKQEVAA
ncbi:GNAT family N-acetyltransferase [Vibrio gallaecicus]|uniref:GNAT family N-acetyltransferase n=1 Tax=Vibrio gallaecicus TaxID=552386 RepID=A0ABV4NGT9_9VIBR